MAYTLSFYNKFRWYIGNGTINMATDQFKVALMNSNHSFVPTHTDWAEVSVNGLATGNGYTSGGKLLTSVTWTESGGVVVWDAADASWTATGGPLGPATHAVIYSDTSTGDKLVCSIAFNESFTAGEGTDFKITWHASNGIFRSA